MSAEKLSDIVIVDFETTGLGPDKEPWEWAALKMSSATGWRPDIRGQTLGTVYDAVVD